MATTVLGLKTFAASDPVDVNEVNDNYVKIDGGVKTAMQGRAAHNWLDNSWFVNPVNQRGQATYNTSGYCIDRWLLDAGSASIGDSGITLTGATFVQRVALKAGTYTFALHLSDGTTLFINIQYDGKSSITQIGGTSGTTGAYINSYNYSQGVVTFQFVQGAGVVHIASWAALYEGSYDASTLPAYQPKGYAAELAECQRYFWRCDNTWFAEGSGYAFSNAEYRVSIILPQMMRVTPTMISSTGNTTSYGIKIHTGAGANLTPTAVSLSMKNNRIDLTLTGNFTNGELGVLRLENDYLDFSADL